MATLLEPPRIMEVLTDGVLLHNVSWSTYESLLRDHPDAASPRFTYDRGDLLIMVTSPEHEKINRTLNLLVDLLAEEFQVQSCAFGSTTYKRRDLKRGFEPDSCFYFKNEQRMRGKKRLNLAVDPPPELVVEIDISNSSLKKLPLFAAFGIAEVWRFDGQEMEILVLQHNEYYRRENSLALPKVTAAAITRFLHESFKIGRLEWIKKVRAWAQQQRTFKPPQ
ncbi:MAG: Uma2 family endonuclease [Pyrinomonadaceae bacterium]|nr:Uma2 family endonuclease [Pyrinomonadaceae bacterium]